MILCLDVGNTQMNCGVAEKGKFILTFRKTSKSKASSDETGVFLRTVLRENNIDPSNIKQITICSVVPEAIHSLNNACLKYFNIEPFLLRAGVKTGLRIKYRNPLEVGTDRIANAIAGINLYPNKNLIIIDFGTATTFCAISKECDYLGGVILPGLRISMESLEKNAAQLKSVEIKTMENTLGRSTMESIQSGLFFGQIGMVKEITKRLTKESFNSDKPIVIATGGFSSLFGNAHLFDIILPNLVLEGLLIALKMNSN
jgi:type III pantothenate kinase